MRVLSILCFVLAGLGAFSAINAIIGPGRPQAAEDTVGYAVGALLVPIIFLIGGLTLWNKSKKKQ